MPGCIDGRVDCRALSALVRSAVPGCIFGRVGCRALGRVALVRSALPGCIFGRADRRALGALVCSALPACTLGRVGCRAPGSLGCIFRDELSGRALGLIELVVCPVRPCPSTRQGS